MVVDGVNTWVFVSSMIGSCSSNEDGACDDVSNDGARDDVSNDGTCDGHALVKDDVGDPISDIMDVCVDDGITDANADSAIELSSLSNDNGIGDIT